MRTQASVQELEARRMVTGRLLQQGLGVNEVARLVGAAPSSVSRWKKVLYRKGLEGLKARPNRGAKPRLNAQQRGQLRRILLRGARKAGYRTDLWTCRRVAEVIWRTFGVSYHPGHVWYLLQRLGWSCQRPEHKAWQGNEEAIRQWRRREWPRIRKGTRQS